MRLEFLDILLSWRSLRHNSDIIKGAVSRKKSLAHVQSEPNII